MAQPLMMSYTAGVIARTVEDVILFDDIFSECRGSRQEIQLNGTRLGYPVNYWQDLDTKVKLDPIIQKAFSRSGLRPLESYDTVCDKALAKVENTL